MFNSSLLSLLQLTDSTIPIGAYAHSSGLETYVQKGIVNDLESATNFVKQMLSVNIQYTDAAFVSLAYDTAMENDSARLFELDNECTAVKLPAEIRSASQKLGMRLIKIFQCLCECDIAHQYKIAIDKRQAVGHYSLVFGIYAAALKIPKQEALTGFYYNGAAAMVTNCVKLIPLGQQHGQGLLFSLHPLIQQLVQTSMRPDVSMIGFCCTGFDIRSMQHEQLYSRLYMS